MDYQHYANFKIIYTHKITFLEDENIAIAQMLLLHTKEQQ